MGGGEVGIKGPMLTMRCADFERFRTLLSKLIETKGLSRAKERHETSAK
jgi:hypothetical protein